jgi:hypothetical protein
MTPFTPALSEATPAVIRIEIPEYFPALEGAFEVIERRSRGPGDQSRRSG